MPFKPNLSILPPPQLRLWSELDATPPQFTLYGGTALALRLGHRTSIDFDFFSNDPVDPDRLWQTVPYLKDAEQVQVVPNTLTCRVERDGPVLVSFFGGLSLSQVAPREQAEGQTFFVASLLDIAATKVDVIQKRAEAKDYLDVDALIGHGIDLTEMLAAAQVVYGNRFNPLAALKALGYFGDVSTLPVAAQRRLAAAVKSVDLVSFSKSGG